MSNGNFACDFVNEHIKAFTESALEALAEAETLCMLTGAGVVNTGHILWGLADTGNGTASGIMDDYDITREKIYEIIYKSGGKPKKGSAEFLGADQAAARRSFWARIRPRPSELSGRLSWLPVTVMGRSGQ